MLLTAKDHIKLADLGQAKKLIENSFATTLAGSEIYMSPEIFKSKFMSFKYFPNTDVWYRLYYNLDISYFIVILYRIY